MMVASPSRLRVVLFSGIFLFLIAVLFNSFSNGATFSVSSLRTKSKRPNGVIFMLLGPNRMTQATMALLNVEDRFNRRLKYPYVLFTAEDEVDGITDEFRAKVNWITEGRATFATTTKESWDVPDNLDKSRVEASMENIGFSTGYRAMCRYYSGFFWRHPALAQYEWLWRLDTDIEFHCDVPYDPIERVIEQNALYGFVQVNYDETWVQPSLASNVSRFLSENAHLVPPDANQGFVWEGQAGIDKAMNGRAGSDEWTKKCMYNNFEISHRSVWESEIYTKFFKFLDDAGGFFYERWGDSPIHSFGLAMSLRKDQAVQFKDMGYQHQKWAYECPVELARCACVKDELASDFHDNAEGWFNPGT